MADSNPDLLALVEHCIHAFERDGESGLLAVLADAGQSAAAAREHIEVLRASGLLQAPEMPERIGGWRILKRLGTGGMGTVWLGEQTVPIARRVAIKVIRPGMDTSEILARFAIEQKALALLDHRGIARILDAGSTPDGRPYLVMEYVAGQPIHRYCDERQLDTRQRLELFVQVCEAVQHAHQKGILHRDLKPSNILVTDRDGTAVPVVIDFGVAKSVGGTLARATQLTLPGRLLGTPEYVSPEQATNEIDVDTRTDVYSLGVVLYELLTSTLPVNGKDLRSGDVARVLREATPQTPSTRITSLGDEAATVAARRRTNIGMLRRALRGDLDWIVLKALERDRNRRYGMPAELAADIVRHLRHEPVTAGAPGAWYRLHKFCVRYRLQVSAAMVVLGALAAGLATSLVFWREASASSSATTRNLDATLQAVDEFLQVGDSDLVAVPHMEGVRRDLLARSVALYQRFLDGEAIGDPRLVPRTLDALVRLSTMQSQLGEHADAMRRWQEVERLLASPATAGLDAKARLAATAEAALGIAHLLDRAAEQARPLAMVRRATEALRALLVLRPQHDHTELRLQRSLRFEANLLQLTDPGRAMALFDDALALARQRMERRPDDPDSIAAFIDLGGDRADLLLAVGKRDACLEATAALRELRQAHRQARSWSLAQAMIDIASIFARCDREQDTIEVVADIAPEVELLVADHPSVLAYRTALIQLYSTRGNAEMRLRDFASALATQREVRTHCEAALAISPADLQLQRLLVVCCINLALYQSEWRNFRGEWDVVEVEAALQRATTILDAVPLGEAQRLVRAQRVEVLRLWGILSEAQGDRDRARADTAAAMAIAKELTVEFPQTVLFRTRLAEVRRRLATLLLDLGRADEARAVIDAAVADSAPLGPEAASMGQWESRHRELLLLQVRARGAAGDADGAFAALADQLARGADDDWIGRQDAARAVTRVVESLAATHPARARFVERGRQLVAESLSYAAFFERRGTAHGTIEVMRGNTLLVARQLEVAVGDLAAAAGRAGEVVEAYAAAWSTNASARGEKRVRDAAAAWLFLLQQLGDGPGGLAALDRLATCFVGNADALAQAAEIGAAFAAAIGDAPTAAMARGKAVELLRQALAAGLAAAALQHERFAPLRGTPAFTALQTAAASGSSGK